MQPRISQLPPAGVPGVLCGREKTGRDMLRENILFLERDKMGDPRVEKTFGHYIEDFSTDLNYKV